MAEKRYCSRCAENVECREEPQGSSLALFCPRCEKRIATTYGHIPIQ